VSNPTPQAACQAALKLLAVGQSAEAATLLEQSLTHNGEHAPSLNYLALAYCDLDRLDDARSALDRLISNCPTNQALPTLECLYFLKSGQIEQALDRLEVAPRPVSPLQQRPELWAFPPLSSRLVAEVESWLLPIECHQLSLEPALDAPPEFEEEAVAERPAPNRVISSGFGMALGMFIGALLGFGLRLFIMKQAEMDVWDSGELPDPVAIFACLIGVSGAAWGFLRPTLPQQMRAQRKQTQGYSLLDKALRCRQPNQRQQYFWLAIQSMREVPDLDPEALRSYYSLGEALLIAAASQPNAEFTQDYLAEARRCFLISWAQDGDNPYLNYYLARTHQLQGKVAAAVTYYERAVSKFDKLSEAHYGLGQCHLLLRQQTEAQNWFARALGTELQLGRDRLVDLSEAQLNGKLDRKRPLPEVPEQTPVVEAPLESSPAEDAPVLAETASQETVPPTDPTEEAQAEAIEEQPAQQ
jgi:tetratricopeptide (TPR) repeat protein